MEQNEIITALHAQLKEAAQRIFANMPILPGRYNATEVDKTFHLSERMDGIALARYKARKEPMRAESELRWASGEMARLEEIGIPDEEVKISYGTFNASMPAALIFAKLVEWEREFKIKTTSKAVFVKEEEGEAIASCTITFPKEAKYIADYCATDMIRPMMTGVYIDAKNSCMVGCDTHVLTVMPIEIADAECEPMNIIVDPKIIKAVAGQKCTVRLLKDVDKNISIKTEKGETYSCANIKGNYPNYQRVLPKVNCDGLVELSDDGIKALSNFAKATVKQAREKRGDGKCCIKIEIPAYSSEGTARYFDVCNQSEKSVKFSLKGSPRINVVFGIDAFNLSIVTKNWNGCLWYADPSRPVVFDNKNTICTISMPMLIIGELSEGVQSGACAGEVDAISRHGANYDVALSEAAKKEEQKREESASILREKKIESAKRYCTIKGTSFEGLTDNDEIMAITHDCIRLRYIGHFRPSGDVVLFNIEKEIIEPTEPPQPTEPIEVSAEEEKGENKANIIIKVSETESGCRYTDKETSKVIAEVFPLDNGNYTVSIVSHPKLGANTTLEDCMGMIEGVLMYDIKKSGRTLQFVTEAPPEPPKPKETPPKETNLPTLAKCLESPPQIKIIITPKIRNHDRNNSLAYPHHNYSLLCLPRIRDGNINPYRYCISRNPCLVAACQVDRQEKRRSNRESRHRPREGDPGMGKEMGKKTPNAQTLTFNTS